METLATVEWTSEEWCNALNQFSKVNRDRSSFGGNPLVKSGACTQIWEYLQNQHKAKANLLVPLSVVKILMRERVAIGIFLSTEAFALFVNIAKESWVSLEDSNEALKCAINSVYCRPKFVELLMSTPFYDDLYELTKLDRPFDFHILVWKCLLMSFEHPPAIAHVERTLDGYSCILPTISYCIHSTNFLFDEAPVLLVVELLKVLYVFASSWQKAYQLPESIEAIADDAMRLLCSVMHLPNLVSLFELKQQAVNLLLLIQHPYLVLKFVEYDGIDPLLSFLDYAIMKVRVEKTKDTKVLTPIVIALHQLAKNNQIALEKLKAAVFNTALVSPDSSLVSNKLGDLPMSPPPLIKGSLQDSFCYFMTSLDTDLKRCVSEFLYTLCQNNALEFTQRTGMGNAVALLRLKGIV